METASSYARSIAYLGDASKIRARTVDMFGRAPSLNVCERIVVERQRALAPVKLIGAGEPDDTDASDFAVRGLDPKAAYKPPRPRHPPMVITFPVKRLNLDLNIPSELAIAVANAFGLPRQAMLGTASRKKHIIARSVYAKLLRDRLNENGEHRFSLKQIATRINRSDHTTVRHMLETYPERAKRFPDMDRVYRELKAAGA